MSTPFCEASMIPLTSDSASDFVQRLRIQLNSVLLGKPRVVDDLLCAVLANGHVLFDDLPGLGKTTLAKGLATALGGRLTRVQCTPDLLPSDITGFNILNQKTREFEFREGPVFGDVLLADEINRTTPRTQSALFEAMAERQVTIDGHTHPLSQTFMVLATQNPIESLGAYPLPEAQLDRFAMKLRIGYPDRSSELDLLARDCQREPLPVWGPVFESGELRCLQQYVAKVSVAASVREYLVSLAEATRQHDAFAMGISPRGLLQWQRIAQARAILCGRSFVTPDDVQEVAVPVLSVRLAGSDSDVMASIEEILSRTPVQQAS